MKAYDKQYINGQWVQGGSDDVLEDINPFTGEVLYTYHAASKDDLDAAYAAAKAAQKPWGETAPGERVALLEGLIATIQSMQDEIYSVLQEEGGSAKSKADFEFGTIQAIVREACKFPYMMNGIIQPSDIPGKDNCIIRQPKGVICTIAPWNVPLVLAMRSVVPAVACGNAVVLKPASDTPATAFLIAEMFERAGFPAGLVNAIAGKGSVIGDAIVEHPAADLISFTGSTEVGRRIGEVAGKMIKDVSLELGGNNVMIVLSDADLAAAARAAAFGGYFNAGQVCMAINRIIVMNDVYDAFAEELIAAVKALPVGNPQDDRVFIGPIISKKQVESVEDYVRSTIESGAGVALEGYTVGNVIYPWILNNVTNDMPSAKNEVFGPVVSLMHASSEDEAIAIANDTEYGLSGSLFTRDLYHGMQVAKRIDSGMVHVNDQSINDEPHVMFGGVKRSGIGRFNGEWVMNKFTTQRWISVQQEYRF